jgi:tellurite resistance protein TerC
VSESHILQWVVFAALVAVLLTLDLFVFHRHARAPSLRESAAWTVFWCLVAAGFGGLIWWWRAADAGAHSGREAAVSFLTGYVVEWSLSMDNVFVFAVIFRFFQVPPSYQYRVLFWGILGAIVLRLAFVLAGVQLIQHFRPVLPLFGLLLVAAALKLGIQTQTQVHPEKGLVLRVARRLLPVSRSESHTEAFFVREDHRLCVTPLLLALLVVESTDVLFAVDSVPAVLGITTDAFIVFTSNIFAVLGLRAMYFLLAGAIEMFRYLHYGLAAVLGFVGLNMIADYFLVDAGKPEAHFVPTWAKLAVIAVALAISIAASVAAKRRAE